MSKTVPKKQKKHTSGEYVGQVMLRIVGNSHVVTIPVPLMRELGLATGDLLTIHSAEDEIVMFKSEKTQK